MQQPRAFSHPQQGRIDFNTVNPSLSRGMDFLIHPCRWIDDEENVRTPPKLGRYWEIHPLRPRDFPRPSRFPSGFALGKSLGSRKISWASGMDFPIPPEFWWSTDILLIINSSTGMDQEIHPSGQGRIDSVKINPSLLRMRECYLPSFESLFHLIL